MSYLALSEVDSLAWRKAFIQTLLERDFPQRGVRTSATTLWRFWSMLSHYHGQTWNAAEFARAMGVSESTTRRYLDLLSDAFMVRQLQPWHANIRKHGLMVGVECKRTDVPRMTPSIRTALSDLNLDKVVVVYPGDKRFSLSAQVEAMPLKELISGEQLSKLPG